MNSRQKEVLIQSLNDEEKALKKLYSTYSQSQTEINKKIRALKKDIEKLDELAKLSVSQEEKEILLSRRQSKVYQKQYQEALKKQVGGILDNMQKSEYKTISDYLNKCYENGFIGAMYDLQGQGIPMCFPLDQKAMARAIRLDSKISRGLYTHLGENVTMLKRKITAEISRGIATGRSFQQIAKQISLKMTGTYENPKGAYAYAARIARTEGHRIQVQSGMDACYKAKEKGADVVKQWDSTLDDSTRESHQKVDGEIRELDKEFSNGLEFPGDPSGGAAEVINCRCALLQRARWALDNDELETLKKRAEYFGLDKTDSFEDYKKKYLKAADNVNTSLTNNDSESGIISKTRERLNANKVEYREVKPFEKQLSEDEIIQRLSGGDMTKGSCSSLAFAYIGNKNGLDVLDFRDGVSREYFAGYINIKQITQDLTDVKSTVHKVKKEAADTAKLLLGLEHGKEYYCAVGKHAAIIRNTENGVEYLELQSNYKNGWISCKESYGSAMQALIHRFGARKTVDRSFGRVWEREVYLMEVDSFKENEEFRKILGYINTAPDKQRKGASGDVK